MGKPQNGAARKRASAMMFFSLFLLLLLLFVWGEGVGGGVWGVCGCGWGCVGSGGVLDFVFWDMCVQVSLKVFFSLKLKKTRFINLII